MSEPAPRRFVLLLALLACLAPPLAAPAAAEPVLRLLDLPFRVSALRGPASEVAVAVATSGLLPLAGPRARPAAPEPGEEDRAPVVVVWGEGGGAAFGLGDGGALRTTLLAAEAVEGLAASETPRGAVPGSRRALSGPLSAYLTGSTRAAGGLPAAAAITIRERQPTAVSADPKPVPVATVTVPAGPDAVFASARPRSLRLDGKPAFLAATLDGAAAGGLALLGRGADGHWSVLARSPAQPGSPLRLAAVAPFSKAGAPQAAAIRADGTLQIWSLARDGLAPVAEMPGYAAGPAGAELAAAIEPEAAGPYDLALPLAGGTALAVVGFGDGPRERLRIALPAPAATGIAVLGRGPAARLFVGLADGRLAVVEPGGTQP